MHQVPSETLWKHGLTAGLWHSYEPPAGAGSKRTNSGVSASPPGNFTATLESAVGLEDALF